MAPSPSLDHLRTFATVHRAGSLTEAAALLGLSQATVSAHIQALESALGFPVFVRMCSGVVATAKGEELAREVSAHIDALDDITVLSAVSEAAPRRIHVGGPAELLSTMVLPRLHEIERNVDVPLRFVFGLANDLLEALRARTLDVVVSAVRPQARGVASIPLYDEEFVLVAAPRWAGEPLDRIPVIAYAENLPIIRRYWRSVFERRPDDIRLSAVIPDLRGIRSALLSGSGMSVLPHYLVAEQLRSGELVPLHTPGVAPLNTVFLATRGREAARDSGLGAVVAELQRVIR